MKNKQIPIDIAADPDYSAAHEKLAGVYVKLDEARRELQDLETRLRSPGEFGLRRADQTTLEALRLLNDGPGDNPDLEILRQARDAARNRERVLVRAAQLQEDAVEQARSAACLKIEGAHADRHREACRKIVLAGIALTRAVHELRAFEAEFARGGVTMRTLAGKNPAAGFSVGNALDWPNPAAQRLVDALREGWIEVSDIPAEWIEAWAVRPGTLQAMRDGTHSNVAPSEPRPPGPFRGRTGDRMPNTMVPEGANVRVAVGRRILDS